MVGLHDCSHFDRRLEHELESGQRRKSGRFPILFLSGCPAPWLFFCVIGSQIPVNKRAKRANKAQRNEKGSLKRVTEREKAKVEKSEQNASQRNNMIFPLAEKLPFEENVKRHFEARPNEKLISPRYDRTAAEGLWNSIVFQFISFSAAGGVFSHIIDKCPESWGFLDFSIFTLIFSVIASSELQV